MRKRGTSLRTAGRIACAVLALQGILTFMTTAPARAADFSIGPTVWYLYWRPYTDVFRPDAPVLQDFMYGGAASLRFLESWTVSTRFLAGTFRREHEETISENISPYDGTFTKDTPEVARLRMFKADSDTTLAYSLSRYVRLFAGFKYSHYRLRESRMTFRQAGSPGSAGPYWETSIHKSEDHHYGGGAGLGLSFPVADNFYILLNVNGVIMQGTAVFAEEKYTPGNLDGSNGIATYYGSDYVVFMRGGNGELGFSYYLSSLKVALSLGFRYQQLQVMGRPAKACLDEDELRWHLDGDDRFYGVTFTAMCYVL